MNHTVIQSNKLKKKKKLEFACHVMPWILRINLIYVITVVCKNLGEKYWFISHLWPLYGTPPRTPRMSGLKSQVLKANIFELKMMVKSGLEFFYFEFLLALSNLPTNLPDQFSLSRQIVLHWATVTLKGLVEFQNKTN